MALTVAFMLSTERMPAAPIPPQAQPQVIDITPQTSRVKLKQVKAAATPGDRQHQAGRFPLFASTTYGAHGQPNRPWLPTGARLDIFA